MTATHGSDRFDRFERDIPELMDALAPVRRPDYFDDMLLATARTRQRPAWSALERWLPMGEIAGSIPRPALPWRPIVLMIVLTLLVLAGALVIAGSQRPLPAPFGPAGNGVVLFSAAGGDIVSADVVTGEVTPVIGGATRDSDPIATPDGRQFVFTRDGDATTDGGIYIANIDGTDIRPLVTPSGAITAFDWAPDGSRFAVRFASDPAGRINIVDAGDGSSSSFDLDVDVQYVTWRPGSEQLVVTGSDPEGTLGYFLVGAEGARFSPIVTGQGIVNAPAVSPDGATLAYSTWDDAGQGRTHLIDIDTRRGVAVDFAPDFEFTDLSPRFSPDGSKLLVVRSDIDGYLLTIMSTDGSGSPLPLGVHHPDMTNGAIADFSPDGTQVLATYQDDGTTWVFDAETGEGHQLPWGVPRGMATSWQRVAR